MLLQKIIELAKESGCKKVRLQVSKWNTNAIEFYQKMNAAIDETEINCDLLLGE
jgi:ribosomal protein S18 acetylase RimI-like enzyme